MDKVIDLDELRKGSIDMHVHHGPDPAGPRRVDAIEAARQAQQAGMRAIVLKSHQYPTQPLVIIVRMLVPGMIVYGSIALDYEIGGLNFHALEASAKLGAKVVWMPTFSSNNSRSILAKLSGKPVEGEGYSIIDEKGKLVPEMPKILSLIKQYDMVLATGHISPEETFAVVEGAKAAGMTKIVITHPMEAQFVVKALTVDDLKRLTKMGAYAEFCGSGLMPAEGENHLVHWVKTMKTLGPEHCIMSTDLGQARNPPPAEGMRMFMAALLSQGITADEIEIMSKKNPAKLLGLE